VNVTAIVPAYNAGTAVADAVTALRDVVDEVVVVDDASSDDTAAIAQAAGARVLRLPNNIGKGGAVAAGVRATPEADAYVLVDADAGMSAAGVVPLLPPVVHGDADLAVGVLPAGATGGLGTVRRLAGAGIQRASGFRARAPLSGQRVVRGELLRSLELAPRFGLETGMTIDAVRAGARVVEVDVDMAHRATGRSPAGFAHRARQGADILRALWSRLTTERQRIVVVALAFVIFAGWAVWEGGRWLPSSVGPSAQPAKVVLVGLPFSSFDNLTDFAPVMARGAIAASSIRTSSEEPSVVEAYATIGAGTRVAAAVDPNDLPAAVRLAKQQNKGKHLSSAPGALGDALHKAGKRTAFIGDTAAGMAVADSNGQVDFPRTDLATALGNADVIVVGAKDGAALAAAVPQLPSNALLIAIGVTPPLDEWRLEPTVAIGAGVRPGYLESPSTKRLGVVTITDLAPTMLDALRVPVPEGMIGHPLRYHPGTVDLTRLRNADRDAAYREYIYFNISVGYIIVQAVLYGLAIIAFNRLRKVGRLGYGLRWLVLAIAAWPLATFVFRAVPGAPRLGFWGGLAVLIAISAAIATVACRARRHPLSPLSWILFATVAALAADIVTGARLQMSSILGYSLHTAARFTGIGNSAFAALAASALLWAAAHLAYAPRRREAIVTVALVLAGVVLIDGAPTLGDDVGGILTLVPVFGLAVAALAGVRLRVRTIVFAGLATLGLLASAIGFDLLRPPQSRTHLGRLVAEIGKGGSNPFTTTVARKLTTNLHTYKSVWCWVIVIVAVYMLYVLGWERGWSRLLPRGSALRIGAVATLACGLVGNFLNDSGAVVTALVFVYVGPFLTLLALHRETVAT
jgi:hypothetical protein